MARFARVVVADVAHHVTQRGNARQVILSSDIDRAAYLELLRHYSEFHGLSLLGYCLMSNHVHLIVVPHAAEALAQALKHAHGRYASYWNARNSSGGHVWQGRFYSCPLDETHLWRALRYAELNPVRAGMVPEAADWRWSSAAAHCGSGTPEPWLEMERWQKRWTTAESRLLQRYWGEGATSYLMPHRLCPTDNCRCTLSFHSCTSSVYMNAPWDL